MLSCTPLSSGEHVSLCMKKVVGTLTYWPKLPLMRAEDTLRFKTQGQRGWECGKGAVRPHLTRIGWDKIQNLCGEVRKYWISGKGLANSHRREQIATGSGNSGEGTVGQGQGASGESRKQRWPPVKALPEGWYKASATEYKRNYVPGIISVHWKSHVGTFAFGLFNPSF